MSLSFQRSSRLDDLPRKAKVKWKNESDLSITVWTGYDEMIKIEESEDAQDCLEFQRLRRSIEIQNGKFLADRCIHYMLNASSRCNLRLLKLQD